MLKLYELNGYVFQYEEGTQPKAAKEVAAKQAKPANKERKAKEK